MDYLDSIHQPMRDGEEIRMFLDELNEEDEEEIKDGKQTGDLI